MNRQRLVLVTGANGFIGRGLSTRLLGEGVKVRLATQHCPKELVAQGGEWSPLPDLSGPVEWGTVLDGVTQVVHLAGMAHRISGDPTKDAGEYDRVNHLAVRDLASALAGHRILEKFVFISSVAVHGEPCRFPVRAEDPLSPVNPYGKSKLDAELALRQLLAEVPFPWVIFRPVLVYGPGNPGNMARLERIIRSGLPVPVGRIPNRKSFLFLDNLVDLICTYLETAEPPSRRAYIVADSEVHSTAELVFEIAAANGIRGRIWPIPEAILEPMARVGDGMGRLGLPSPWNSSVREKLLGDFYVDIAPIRADLKWNPPFSLREGLAKTYR